MKFIYSLKNKFLIYRFYLNHFIIIIIIIHTTLYTTLYSTLYTTLYTTLYSICVMLVTDQRPGSSGQ